eukprot:491977-Pleurochrysis_carterae.AAC.1
MRINKGTKKKDGGIELVQKQLIEVSPMYAKLRDVNAGLVNEAAAARAEAAAAAAVADAAEKALEVERERETSSEEERDRESSEEEGGRAAMEPTVRRRGRPRRSRRRPRKSRA